MISSNAIVIVGFVLAAGMVVWGLAGVFTGKVLTKSYGTVDGEGRYYRFVSRQEEPVWFWTLCGVYTAIGIGMLLVLYFVMHRA